VKIGDPVAITLPDGRTTAGVLSRIGTVATSSSNNGAGSGSSPPTIPIYITLEHPQAAGNLDRAPVQTRITTTTVKHTLAVPVTALRTQTGGGYTVETLDARGVHHLVAVAVGLFDDANGLVQVRTSSLAAGEHVLLPATTAS
jgi:hypothetical protein